LAYRIRYAVGVCKPLLGAVVKSYGIERKRKVIINIGVSVKELNEQTLDVFAKLLNPKMRGWINYRYETLQLFCYVNERIKKWIANKYKLRTKKRILAKYQAIQAEQPDLFYHWRLGIKA